MNIVLFLINLLRRERYGRLKSGNEHITKVYIPEAIIEYSTVNLQIHMLFIVQGSLLISM